MTTEIVVKANHGWPVRVTGIDPVSNAGTGYGGIVAAGDEGRFHCHSNMDLVIHEIQPGENSNPANPLSTDDTSAPADDSGKTNQD